jgi:hypothetical protein
MHDDPAATPQKPRRKGGRPSRAEASAKALQGVNLAQVDPMAILRAIAADLSAPASARVSAAKALLERRDLAEAKQLRHGRAGPRPSKRALAQRAAATAGGVGSGWGDDLVWPDGRHRHEP